jgi:hypothetical protein
MTVRLQSESLSAIVGIRTAYALAVAMTFPASPSQAFLLLLGAGQQPPEPKNTAQPRGLFLTEQQLAAEAAKRPAPPPVFMFPMDRGMVLAQAGQPGEPTREVPFWRVELHPPNDGATLTDPDQVLFARPGQLTGLFRTELPRAAGVQLNIFTYRLTGTFRATEQGSYSFAVRHTCTWACNISLSVAGQQVIRLDNHRGGNTQNNLDRTERFAAPLPAGDYPIEVVFGFPRPRDAESTITGQTGAPRFTVLMRRPSDETLVPIEVFNRVPASRAAVPVPLN